MEENIHPAGYIVFYIKDGITKNRHISTELKEPFMEKFGGDPLNINEEDLDKFIADFKNLKK